MSWKLRILRGLFTIMTAAGVHGSVIFSDDFSYPDGPLVTVSQGVWKTHSGTAGQAEVVSGELRLSQKKSEDVSGPFAGGLISPTNNVTLYARFVVNFASLPTGPNGGYFAHFKDGAVTTGLRARIFATTNGATAGRFRLGIAAGTNAPTAILPRDLNLRTRYRLVCRLVLASAKSTLWLNPRAESDSGVTATDSASAKNVTAFAFRESLSSGAGMGELTVDSLAVATRFDETALSLAPVLESEPQNQSVASGETLTLSVAAAGSEPLFYQWFWNGAELPGATDPTLLLSNLTLATAGDYQVVVSNEFGSVTSALATVSILADLLTVQISTRDHSTIRLFWDAEPEQSYSVWMGAWDAAGFTILASDLFFADRFGFFEEPVSECSSRFYRVCADWGIQ